MTVSVVVTTYNQSAYIEATLGSVLAQQARPDEVIVVDDGSSDDTAARVRAFQGRVILREQANQGVAASRNAGVAAARGDLVALLDGDDLWHPQKLELQIAAFERFPDTGLVAVRCQTFTDRPPSPLAGLSAASVVMQHGHRLADLLDENFLWTTSQVAIPRRVLERIGPSNTRYRICSDYDLYLRIARDYPITMIEAPLTYWRTHDASASGPRSLRPLQWAPETVAVLRRAARTLPAPFAQMARDQAGRRIAEVAQLAFDRVLQEDRTSAVRCLRDLAVLNPGYGRAWLYFAGSLASPTLRRSAARIGRSLGFEWRG